MWKEIVLLLVGFVILAGAVGFYYYSVPGEPVNLDVINFSSEDEPIDVDYGQTPVFAENLRYNHQLVSYYIEPDCSAERIDKMKEAFLIFHDTMEVISFYEVKDKEKAEILVGCSEDYIEEDGGMFRAGEGGPSKFINGTFFKIILEGKIVLYQESNCDYPVVELHELLHVFGFDHNQNPKSLMYPVSDCDQRITQDMIEVIKELYKVEPLADVYISNLTAVKKRYYLDFNISVENKGLIDAGEVELKLYNEDGKELKKFDVGNLSVFTARTLTVKNLRVGRFDDLITFNVSILDNSNESDFKNNAATLGLD